MTTEKQNPEPEHAGIYEAIACFQYDCPTITKGKKGFGYNYAELSKTIEIIKPFLKKHKIGFTQILNGENELQTCVFHYPTKTEIVSILNMPSGYTIKSMNLYQTDGARNTYYKRYVLLGILGVMTEDEDHDAQGKVQPATNSEKIQTEKPKQKLNNTQFVQLIGAIKTDKTTVEKALDFYDLNEQQIETLNT